MNLIILEYDCKKEARKCFDNFKHHLINYPFLSVVNNDSVFNAIKWEIEMKFGASVLKSHIIGKKKD